MSESSSQRDSINAPPISGACNKALLQLSLDDRLTDQQEEWLVGHLTSCGECQQELEGLAGGAGDWSRVSTALQLGVGEMAGSFQGKAGTLSGSAVEREEAGESHIDFAVDFLEPAHEAGDLGRLGEIDIRQIIGRGGMGIVLQGFQKELNRPVAVKVLSPHLASSSASRKRFAREAQAAAAVMHPNVMPILNVNSSGKLPYLIMPYVACESLQQRLDREGPLELVDILRIGAQTASGLAAAHAQGLVHRDVKPANILLEKSVDRVLLTDFGLARAVDDASLTRTGIVAGTPQFMSPEQARGDAVDARSDLFSLGSVLYTMATGRPPFRAESTYGILRRITDTPARPIREINPHQTPEWLELLVDRLHAKEPADRFQTAAEVAQVLEQCLAHVQQPLVAALPTVLQPIRRSRFWSKGTSRLLLVAAIVLVVVIGPMWIWKESSQRRADRGTVPVNEEAPNRSATSPPGPAWEDSVASELQQVEQRVRKLEAETRLMK